MLFRYLHLFKELTGVGTQVPLTVAAGCFPRRTGTLVTGSLVDGLRVRVLLDLDPSVFLTADMA